MQQRQSGDKADTIVPPQQEGTAQKTIETRATLAARLATKLDERLVPAKVEHLFPGAGDEAPPPPPPPQETRIATAIALINCFKNPFTLMLFYGIETKFLSTN